MYGDLARAAERLEQDGFNLGMAAKVGPQRHHVGAEDLSISADDAGQGRQRRLRSMVKLASHELRALLEVLGQGRERGVEREDADDRCVKDALQRVGRQ